MDINNGNRKDRKFARLVKRRAALVFMGLLIFVSTLALSQDLIPLAKNNQWIYERTVVEKGKEATKDTIKTVVERPVMVNGTQWFLYDDAGMKLMIRNTKEGHYELDSAEVDAFGNFRQFLIYKNPEKNDTIHYRLRNGGVVLVSDKVYPVETPMGNFDCYKYSIVYPIDDEYRFHTYICPGIGMVFSDVEVAGRLVQMKLIDYKIH